MKEINLDARAWRNRDDFYGALLPSLGAPHWHGRNLDALNDSLRYDDINASGCRFISGLRTLPQCRPSCAGTCNSSRS
jgi:hypothetical protein